MSVMTKPAWIVDAAKQEALDAGTQENFLKLIDPDGWWEASVRDEGCVDLRRFHNEPYDGDPDMTDYIHICDVDALIARLQQLKIRAQLHFGWGWE